MDLFAAANTVYALCRACVTDAAPWRAATDALAQAVAACDDPTAIEKLLREDQEDDLPIPLKSAAFERRLALGPRTAELLRAYAQHLWLHGPAQDELVAVLRDQADEIDKSG